MRIAGALLRRRNVSSTSYRITGELEHGTATDAEQCA